MPPFKNSLHFETGNRWHLSDILNINFSPFQKKTSSILRLYFSGWGDGLGNHWIQKQGLLTWVISLTEIWTQVNMTHIWMDHQWVEWSKNVGFFFYWNAMTTIRDWYTMKPLPWNAVLGFSNLAVSRSRWWCYLKFVWDHMSQSLVIDDSNEDIGFKFSPVYPTVQPLCSIVVIAGWKIMYRHL